MQVTSFRGFCSTTSTWNTHTCIVNWFYIQINDENNTLQQDSKGANSFTAVLRCVTTLGERGVGVHRGECSESCRHCAELSWNAHGESLSSHESAEVIFCKWKPLPVFKLGTCANTSAGVHSSKVKSSLRERQRLILRPNKERHSYYTAQSDT